MRGHYRPVIAGCLMVSGTATAAAAEASDRRYETIWQIQPDATQAGARTIAAGQPVIEQRLLPTGLAVADEDVVSDAGKVLVQKGTQLFQLRVGTGRTWCVADVPRPSAWRSMMLGGGNLQLCLIDADADGRFDGHFNGGNPMKGVPFIEGKQPKSPKIVRSGRYSPLPPENFALGYKVRILAEAVGPERGGKASIRYRIDFGDDVARQKLSSTIEGSLGETSILGARWRVLRVAKDEMAIEVVAPMPDQPFSAVQTRVYR